VKAQLVLLWPGRTTAEYARAGISDYLERIRRYRPCRVLRVAAERHDGHYSAAHRIEREGVAILRRIDTVSASHVVALDAAGELVSSRRLAELVRLEGIEAGRNMVFVLGGPDGLSSGVLKRADRRIGLSRMTLPHDMARLVLTEQIYRALTIIHRHPYDR